MNTQARYPQAYRQGVHERGTSPKSNEKFFFEFCLVRINFRHLHRGCGAKNMKHRRDEKTAQAKAEDEDLEWCTGRIRHNHFDGVSKITKKTNAKNSDGLALSIRQPGKFFPY